MFDTLREFLGIEIADSHEHGVAGLVEAIVVLLQIRQPPVLDILTPADGGLSIGVNGESRRVEALA